MSVLINVDDLTYLMIGDDVMFDRIRLKVDKLQYYMKFTDLCYDCIDEANNLIRRISSIANEIRACNSVQSYVILMEATGNILLDDIKYFTDELDSKLIKDSSSNVVKDSSGKYSFCWDVSKAVEVKRAHNIDFNYVIERIVNFDKDYYGKRKDVDHTTIGDQRWQMQFPYVDEVTHKCCVLKVIYAVRMHVDGYPVIRLITAYPLFYDRSIDRKEMFVRALKAEAERNNPNPGKIIGGILIP